MSVANCVNVSNDSVGESVPPAGLSNSTLVDVTLAASSTGPNWIVGTVSAASPFVRVAGLVSTTSAGIGGSTRGPDDGATFTV